MPLFLEKLDFEAIYWAREGKMSILVEGCWRSNPGKWVSDALRGVSFEDDAGKSPDFLELLMGYQRSAQNRVGDNNHPV